MDDINVQIVNMDVMIPEHVVQNQDGSYTIFLNARLTRERQLEAYEHALRHIQEEDFSKTDVQIIETRSHTSSENIVTKPSVPTDIFLERMQASHKRRKRAQRRFKKYQNKMDFISQYGDSFALAEHEYLYGKDL